VGRSDTPTASSRPSMGTAHATAVITGALGLQSVLAVVAQAALGWWLSDSEFGVYALAAAIASFIQVFRDGGVTIHMSRVAERDFNRVAGPAFHFSVASGIACGVVIAAMAPVAGHLYDAPEVSSLLLVLAGTAPLAASSSVAIGKLRRELRYRALVAILVGSAVLRYGATVLLAWGGAGVLSFVLPLYLVHLYEFVASYGATGIRPWLTRISIREMSAIGRANGWLLLGSGVASLFGHADYIGFGLTAPVAFVGVYYFAYQLSVRGVLVLTEAVRQILLARFVQIAEKGDPGVAVRKAIQLGTLIAVGFLGLLLVAFPAVEELVWRGRWSTAVVPVQLLAAVFPLQLSTAILETYTQAIGSFRFWTALMVVRTTTLAVVASLAGVVATSKSLNAGVSTIALYLCLGYIIEACYLARRIGLGLRVTLESIVRPYIFGAAAAAVALAVDSGAAITEPAARLIVVAGCYCLVFGVAGLTFLRSDTIEMVRVARRPSTA
jgi:O-antigen/teichoic acid export membrane protein